MLAGINRASGELYTCVIPVRILLYINWESGVNDCCWSLLYESSYGFLFEIEMNFSHIDVSLKRVLLIETYRGELACVNSRQVSLGVDVNPHK